MCNLILDFTQTCTWNNRKKCQSMSLRVGLLETKTHFILYTDWKGVMSNILMVWFKSTICIYLSEDFSMAHIRINRQINEGK